MCWAWVVLSSSAGILSTAGEEGKETVVRAAEGKKKDPHSQTFLFIATITDSIGKGRCSGKPGKHLTVVGCCFVLCIISLLITFTLIFIFITK